jgi:hypothetical protein
MTSIRGDSLILTWLFSQPLIPTNLAINPADATASSEDKRRSRPWMPPPAVCAGSSQLNVISLETAASRGLFCVSHRAIDATSSIDINALQRGGGATQ